MPQKTHTGPLVMAMLGQFDQFFLSTLLIILGKRLSSEKSIPRIFERVDKNLSNLPNFSLTEGPVLFFFVYFREK